MTQVAFPVEVTPQEIAREKTLGGAIGLCAKAAGYEPKDLLLTFKWDKAQWSRWESGQEGIVYPKLRQVMDHCGNNAPVLWMAHDCGYDLTGMRRRETETERENRLLREQLAQERAEREIERRLFRELRAAA